MRAPVTNNAGFRSKRVFEAPSGVIEIRLEAAGSVTPHAIIERELSSVPAWFPREDDMSWLVKRVVPVLVFFLAGAGPLSAQFGG